MTPKKTCGVGCVVSFWLLVIVSLILLRPSIWETQSPDGQLLVRVTYPSDLGTLVWRDPKVVVELVDTANNASTVLKRGSEEFPQQVIWKPDSSSFLYVYSAEPIAFWYDLYDVYRSPLRGTRSYDKSWVRSVLLQRAHSSDSEVSEQARGLL